MYRSRTGGSLDKKALEFLSSTKTDRHILDYDILGSEAHMERALQGEPEMADVGPLLSIDGIIEAEHIFSAGKSQEHLFVGHVGVHAIVGVDVRDVLTDGECSIVAFLEE